MSPAGAGGAESARIAVAEEGIGLAGAKEAAGSATPAEADARGCAAGGGGKAIADSEGSPSGAVEGEAPPEGAGGAEDDRARRMRAVAENNSLAAVFADVRERSRSSELVEPTRWTERGFVPEHMDAESFEMFVYDYLAEHGDASQDGAKPLAEADAPQVETASASKAAAANERVRRRGLGRARSATRTVGVPVFERDRAAEEDAAARDAARAKEARRRAERAEEAKRAAQEAEAQEASFDPDDAGAEDPFASLKLPDGYRLARIDGEYVLVPDTDEDGVPVARAIDCGGIVALVGARSYYLYDRTGMTDAYAHWAFLAAEGDPLVTFADCVREDSRVYPRPLAATSLKNAPFCMTDDDIEAVWEAACASGDYDDIERTVASNGDVYFYSTKYLSPRLAQARAEWNSVGRVMNV